MFTGLTASWFLPGSVALATSWAYLLVTNTTKQARMKMRQENSRATGEGRDRIWWRSTAVRIMVLLFTTREPVGIGAPEWNGAHLFL
jgi:hypothetical protein